MAYKSMLTQSNIQSYIERLKKEEEGQDFLESLINDFLTLSKKIDIKISDGIKHEEIKDNGTIETCIQYKVTISRKYRKRVIKTSLEYTNPLMSGDLVVQFQQPDLSDVLLDVRLIIISTPNSFDEYCRNSLVNVGHAHFLEGLGIVKLENFIVQYAVLPKHIIRLFADLHHRIVILLGYQVDKISLAKPTSVSSISDSLSRLSPIIFFLSLKNLYQLIVVSVQP